MTDGELKGGRRRSLRLAGYDYSSPGMYFVTVCTVDKKCLFGRVEGREVRLNSAGDAVVEAWKGIQERFSAIQLDAFVAMPNHFHGVIFILSGGISGANSKSKDSVEGAASSAPTADRFVRPTLGEIMRVFKSISAIKVNEMLGRKGTPVWQRTYFERILRRGKELEDVRRYIAENPERWVDDDENPEMKT